MILFPPKFETYAAINASLFTDVFKPCRHKFEKFSSSVSKCFTIAQKSIICQLYKRLYNFFINEEEYTYHLIINNYTLVD